MKEYFTIKEIGNLFDMSVQTLQYYDKIGLFKPVTRGENGYRHYKIDQMYELAYIKFMRKMSYHISEIQDFLKVRTEADSLNRLYAQTEIISKRCNELMEINRAIFRKIDFVREKIKSIDLDNVSIKSVPEKKYIQIGNEESIYMSDIFYFYPTVVFYDKQDKIFSAEITGDDEENIITKDNIYTIPAGKYLLGYHKGPYSGIVEKVKDMKALYPDLVFPELAISTNIIDQFLEKDAKNFVTEILIPINGRVPSE